MLQYLTGSCVLWHMSEFHDNDMEQEKEKRQLPPELFKIPCKDYKKQMLCMKTMPYTVHLILKC